MTNYELLTLAAKAVGMDSRLLPFDIRDWHWNPLIDDGDAFRLAVRIVQLTSFHRFMKNFIQAFKIEEHFSASDGCLPTRRAIVRVAAEIGKQ